MTDDTQPIISTKQIEAWQQRLAALQQQIAQQPDAPQAWLWHRKAAIAALLIQDHRSSAVEDVPVNRPKQTPALHEQETIDSNDDTEGSKVDALDPSMSRPLRTGSFRSRLANIAGANQQRVQQAQSETDQQRWVSDVFAQQRRESESIQTRRQQEDLVQKLLSIDGATTSPRWATQARSVMTFNDMLSALEIDDKVAVDAMRAGSPASTEMTHNEICTKCRYDLRGSANGFCPECGHDNRLLPGT